MLMLKVNNYNEIKNFSKSKYGILEPPNDGRKATYDLDLLIVPGLGFDKEGNRLGRGAGYYDRFISKTNAYLIGICFKEQILDLIPMEKWDKKMNELIYD